MNDYCKNDLTFVICAFKESRYLEECIKSLKNQTINVKIIAVTSTPNQYIADLCNKYSVPLFINTGEKGIAEDWNFGYSMAKTKLVTIAHQDDVYRPEYAETLIANINLNKKTLIAFSDYGELRDGIVIENNKLLSVKRKLLIPLRIRGFQSSKFIRRRALSLGNPICCPAVTYVKQDLPNKIFESYFLSNVDWQTWENISKMEGAFVYVPRVLMYHRIHENSTTTAIIADNDRSKEDYEMLCKFWPKWIARIIEHFYKQGEKSNEI